jgi:pimeloyl-ACP methyl ester carboxylesterase
VSAVQVHDITIYYELHGAGEPLLLIPGLATDVSEYQGIIDALAQSVLVIALDNRGAGRTDKPDIPYSMELMAEDAAGLLDALNIKQAHILGISMGGRIALALALRHPEQVKSLILVSTGAKVPSPSWRRRLQLELAPRLSLLRGTKQHPQPYYAFVRQREASQSYDCTDRLQEIRVPTLILHGKRDRVAPLRLAQEMRARIANAQLVTFPGGHIFFFLRPRPFGETVIAFVKTV